MYEYHRQIFYFQSDYRSSTKVKLQLKCYYKPLVLTNYGLIKEIPSHILSKIYEAWIVRL